MATQFVPHQEEELIVISVTKREALVIQELRTFAFGKLTVQKANGMVIRVEPNVSKIIDDNQELTIPIVE